MRACKACGFEKEEEEFKLVKGKREKRCRACERDRINKAMIKTYAESEAHRIKTSTSAKVKDFLTGISKNNALCLSLCGCTITELRAHFQSLFTGEMTWQNFGKVWEKDHIIPCAKFNWLDPLDVKRCHHYTNLQPLTKEANRQKGQRILQVA